MASSREPFECGDLYRRFRLVCRAKSKSGDGRPHSRAPLKAISYVGKRRSAGLELWDSLTSFQHNKEIWRTFNSFNRLSFQLCTIAAGCRAQRSTALSR